MRTASRMRGIALLAIGIIIVGALGWYASPAPVPVEGSTLPSGPVSPLCGSNEVLLCRGGIDQGEPCVVDADCPNGICTRMGHPRRCSVDVFCNVSKSVRCSDNFSCPLYPFDDPDDWCPSGIVAMKSCQTDADCGEGRVCINGIAQCEYEAPRISSGHSGDLVGDWVIGQCSLEDGTYNAPTAASLATAVGIEFDPAPPRRLYVADFFRVTAFEGKAIDESRSAASVVIGQAAFDRKIDHVGHRLPGDLSVGGFYSEAARTFGRQFDRAVKAVSTPDMDALWITDVKRVGRYPRRAVSNAAMDLVLGSTDFNGTRVVKVEGQIEHAADVDAQPRCVGGDRIGTPCGRDADCPQSECATTLAVADCGFNRVAVWRRPPSENGALPDVCLGQPSCSMTLANRGQTTTAESLFCAKSLAFDSKGNLWVLDAYNHRAVRYDKNFTQAAHATTLVFGQDGFDSSQAGRSDVRITIGEGPGAGIDFDSHDNMAIADIGNGRVLFVPPPYEKATRVVGVGGFTDPGPGISTDGVRCDRLASARDVVFDDADNLWVADSNNGRALRFAAGFAPTNAAADVMQGQISCGVYHYLHVGPTSFGRGHGHGAAIIRSGEFAGLGCFGDSQDNRILCWRNVVAARSGMPPADFVLGQPGFDSFLPNRPSRSASTLHQPMLMSFIEGESPRLVVADRENHRVLGYRVNGLKNGAAADLVLGQGGSFEAAKCGARESQVTAETLCHPMSARADSEGNIWVADHGAGRVLLYCFGAAGSASGVCTKDNIADAVADLVLGKTDMQTKAEAPSPCTSPTASTLCRPYDVVSDPGRSRVIVSDQADNRGARVLVYAYPLADGMAASTVIGIPTGRFDAYEPSTYGACWGGAAEGKACRYVEPAGAPPGTGKRTCVGGARAHAPCGGLADCPRGTCGCPSPGVCDYARSLDGVTAADALALHPTLDILYVGKGPHLHEYRGPLKSGMRAERAGGFTVPHNFNSGSTGYTECQWDRLGGGLAFDAANSLYVPQGGAEEFTGVLILADPGASAPTRAIP